MEIKYLVVHCSDTPNNRDVDAKEIHGWHLQNGWDGIGYHAVIKRDGTIERGRPEYWQGSHVRGHNDESLGVCLIGRDQFTDDQLESLRFILRDWKLKYPLSAVVGHRDLDPKKTCPNMDIAHWIATGEVKP